MAHTALPGYKTGKSAVAKDGTVATQKHAAQLAVYELKLASHALDTDFSARANYPACRTPRQILDAGPHRHYPQSQKTSFG